MANRRVLFDLITKIFQTYKLFPRPNEKHFNLKFWLLYIHIMSCLIYMSCIGLCYMAIASKDIIFRVVIENAMMCISSIGATITLLILHNNREGMEKLMDALEDFGRFGVPKDTEENARFIARMVNIGYVYSAAGCFVYYFAGLYNSRVCEAINVENDVRFLCGYPVYFWFPIDLNYSPVKYLWQFLSMSSGFFVMVNSITFVCLVYSIILLINSRTRHLRSLFVDAFKSTDGFECLMGIRKCYAYHRDILRLADQMNEICSAVGLLHLLWASAVLGISCYELVLHHSLGSCIHLSGWLSALFTISYGSQTLIDESDSLEYEVFSSNWYEKDIKIQKELVLVLLRMQKTPYFAAKHFGNLNFHMLQKIINSAYQFLTLLLHMV